ncbi:MAG: hypothetical protein OXH78_13635 [Acidimicrobiaceae bacterium]|nr:hypothetical protein [Acidimicrobiaceae bacterium]
MANTGDLRVSHRGQMSLPAAPRRRWGLHDGGDVAYLDLGGAMLLFPGRIADLRAEVLASITDADWENSSRGFGDPELATE